MYKTFNYENIKEVHEEICSIAKIKNEDEAIVKAFHFQRYYSKAIKDKMHCTGTEAIRTTLNNIRCWIGNEDAETASRIDFLWGNIPR